MFSNNSTIYGTRNTCGVSPAYQQYASFQFKPWEYYSQFPYMYDYQSWNYQPQFASVYANPLTNVSRLSSNPYAVQPPIANISFAKSGK